MQTISADERLGERRGAKALILGPVGVGKTSLLRTVDVERTLFVDIEAGDLAIIDLAVPTIRIDDWVTARDLACRIGGFNKSFGPTMPYSEAHHRAIGGALEDLDRYDLIFVDSISAISRLSYRWSEQQPEAFSERTGKKDARGAYGLHGREMLLWLNQLQHAREKNIVFVGVLERVLDEFNRGEWQLQCEGSKTSRELPAIVDEILTMNFLDFGDDQPPSRGFVTRSPNFWAIREKTAAEGSTRSSRPISEDFSRNLRRLVTAKEPENERELFRL
jgi:hypothetical protein